MGRHSITSHSAHRAIRVAGIVGFVALVLCCDANVLTSLHIINKVKAEESLIGGLGGRFHPSLGDEGTIPDLNGAIGWLNSAPLSAKTLLGKVVLVDFWTYTCINSLRPLPYVRVWAAKYKDAGLVVIGVHTPEFSFEKEPANVQNAVHEFKVVYPIAIDSKYRIWNAFNNDGAHEKLIGAADPNWPDWYAAYMVAEQAGTELPK